ncbi:helix-turn-helix domain-containing protein [Halalkalicoccus subterraneus]|uniref:helix-turn-helix transcriptional regulator n=1 Tax=Halalkalicoccus subterraneus TaxID=2675002 RepID=UPI000EFD3BB9|nr:helix-turn-helix transcriptional regulator [Halalkalicoccus subterraneus]
MSEFLNALRDEVNSNAILGIVVVLGLIVVVTDASWSIFIATGIAIGATAIISASESLPGVNGRALSAVVFAFGTLCGVYVTFVESSYLMGGLTLFASWLTIDALYDTVHGIEPTEPESSDLDEMGASEASRVMYHAGKVLQALDNSPASLSTSELVTRTDLSENEVHESVSVLEDADAVIEERERYELNKNQPGLVRSTVRRLARPFGLFTPSR